MIELQTSVKQDDTTRTRTPKPGYLNLSIFFKCDVWGDNNNFWCRTGVTYLNAVYLGTSTCGI